MAKDLLKLFSKSGMTLSKVSELTKINLSTVQRYINGDVKHPNPHYVDPIYEILKKWDVEVNAIETATDDATNDATNDAETIEINSKEEILDIDVNALKEKINQNTIKPSSTISSANTVTSSNIGGNSVFQVNMVRRGDVVYVRNSYATANEQFGSRPGLIVSSNKLNETLGTVIVVYLTAQPRNPLPTHVSISTKSSKDSIVLTEQLFTVSKDRITRYLTHITDIEMNMVEKGIFTSLDLKYNHVDFSNSADYMRLQIENRMLKDFNEQLLSIARK